VGFRYEEEGERPYIYYQNCGLIVDGPIEEGECRMWGNPIGEIMYETLRYFSGAGAPTSDFAYDNTAGNDDYDLGLPLPDWVDPYDPNNNPYCARAFMLVMSDINPSFDTDQLPGVPAGWGSVSTTLGTLNVGDLANTISSAEGVSGDHYIGQSGGSDSGDCSPKNVSGFGNIRGLCPEDPTKKGGYFSAAVAYYGAKEDIHATAQGSQNVVTYALGLSSPLPKIEIPVGGQTITLVPFGKTVDTLATGYDISPDQGEFQPTNTIVDFFVEQITATYGKFRINFENVEQGSDHDMDAVVIYEYQINGDNTVTITLTSDYSAGHSVQHMGYIISGTTADGTYLEVRDRDTPGDDDADYYLDTPPGQGPGGTWNDGDELPLVATRTFSPGSNPPATLLENPLWYAAKWGGFQDMDDNDVPEGKEWDEDNNGIPDTYHYIQSPLSLYSQLNRTFMDISRRVASGTAASVISTTRSGEGAIYQAVFNPENIDVNWTGDVHALLVDSYGNMREDTNQNRTLDLNNDLIVEFTTRANGSVRVTKYLDSNANGKLEDSERSAPADRGTLDDIQYLWAASEWLNGISTTNIVSQRNYTNVSQKRHIFTFIDVDQDMLPDNNEVIDFAKTNANAIQPYIHLYPPFEDKPGWVPTDASAFSDFVLKQTERVIDFIRGEDQSEYESPSFSYTIPASRSRQMESGETWRLGDVVHSTPTVIGTPAEHFDLLYRDGSYKDFYVTYKNRRIVLYAGGNDGMLHAFSAGFYNQDDGKFYLGYSAGSGFSDSGLALGAELWAYIPYNLLPHLYWLTEKDYDGEVHVSYVDLKPRVFDAKIFTPDTTHPNGWGTVLVGGMRFGGGYIRADVNKDDVYTAGVDRVMRSAYFIMDITDPEQQPELLAEITFSGLGFTTSYPAVVAMKDKDSGADQNNWYLVLGSGPTEASGATNTAMTQGSSTQTAKIVFLDLKKLATDGQIYSLDSNGALAAGINIFAELDSNAFVSQPIAVDLDLDYKTDVLYFGTISGNATDGWGGKLRRIVINDNASPAAWTKNSTLVNNGQPIVAAPTVARDKYGQIWVYFGTGRFYNRPDAADTDQQSFYGVKEPYNAGSATFTWTTVNASDLIDVSDVNVMKGSTTVSDTQQQIASADGWLLDFPLSGERNLGQAVLLGDIITFSTYVPSQDTCTFEGVSYLYALYFETGTAYFESVMGLEPENGAGEQEVIKKVSLGRGLTITPSIHAGKQNGATVFVQSSSGAILDTEQQNPGMTKSGKIAWDEWP
jgi:type IV pilus assembly protein PilY1